MSTFHFQQFSVLQKHSGMKICTDAVLFGAMAPVNPGDHVLDIGT
ncbi:MAG: ribose-phosphate pyrophosphokinase, partial [Methylobacter sp.]|nr:ribose-phosphate pyrophosphokinase [Methylobacter sp.]